MTPPQQTVADAAVTCTHCPAPIVWATTPHGKRMPVDAGPTENGNVWVHPTATGLRAVVSFRGYFPPRTATPHVHHATTCPRAAEWSPSMAKARGASPDRPGRPTTAHLF